jgi:hypothetical protein
MKMRRPATGLSLALMNRLIAFDAAGVSWIMGTLLEIDYRGSRASDSLTSLRPLAGEGSGVRETVIACLLQAAV